MGYAHLESSIGYATATKELNTRYGDSDIIANAYIKKAMNWNKIEANSPNMPQQLDNYSIFLNECLYAVDSIGLKKVFWQYAKDCAESPWYSP
jgi:hypothetical protein